MKHLCGWYKSRIRANLLASFCLPTSPQGQASASKTIPVSRSFSFSLYLSWWLLPAWPRIRGHWGKRACQGSYPYRADEKCSITKQQTVPCCHRTCRHPDILLECLLFMGYVMVTLLIYGPHRKLVYSGLAFFLPYHYHWFYFYCLGFLFLLHLPF